MMFTLTSCNDIFIKAKELIVEDDSAPTSPGGNNNNPVSVSMLTTLAEGYCFLKSDTENFCWGTGIGNSPVNISSNFKTAFQYLKGKSITDIITSKNGIRNCAIDSNNLAYCWGRNRYGAIGDGTTVDVLSPKPLDRSGVLSGKTVKKLILTDDYSCMIASDDKVYCWGDNSYGQFGNGTTTPSASPVAVNMSGALNGKTVKDLVTDDGAVCVIASDDKVYCWGNGRFGGIANGSTSDSTSPVAITPGALGGLTVKSIKLDENTGCVIASDDKVYCWGWNGYGRLGNSTTSNSTSPVEVDFTGALAGKTAKSLVVAGSYTCILASDNQVYCFGYGTEGALGQGAFANATVPVAVDTSGVLSGKTIQKIVGMSSSVCAFASDSKVYCWGYGWRGNLGNGVTGANSAVPVAIDTSGALAGKTVSDLFGARKRTCVKTTDGSVSCWAEGPIGNNTNITRTSSPSPIYMSGDLNGLTINKMVIGDYGSCSIASDNNIYCWGSGEFGSLGRGFTGDTSAPVALKGTDSSDEVILDAKFKTVFDGIVYVQRSNGELFSGEIGSALNFLKDFGSSEIVEIKGVTGANKFLCALTDDEKLFCWGDNQYGQLGDGTSGVGPGNPQQISMTGDLSGKSILSFAVGNNAACAIASDNQVYCWGRNFDGLLGIGGASDSNVPVAVYTGGVLSGKSMSSIVMARSNACVVTATEGKVYCWGANNAVFGDGGFNPSNVPVATDMTGVLNNKKIQTLKLADGSACALTTEGLVACWGVGSDGQMGDGDTSSPGSLIPVAIDMTGALSGKTIKKISTNGYTMCAIASDDKLYCWGYGASGELGDNLQTSSYSPVAVSTTGALSGKSIIEVSISAFSVCALDSNEEVYCWGDNTTSGEVGTGLSSISALPVKLTF